MTGPGAEIWLLAAALDRRSIIDVLAARYGTPRDVVRTDVEALIDRLVADGFLIDDTAARADG